MRQRRKGARGIVTMLAGLGVAAAQEPAPASPPLPDPLTLEAALDLADAPHPDIVAAESELDAAQARRRAAASVLDLEASAELTARYIDPSPVAEDPSSNDSAAEIFVRKRLYDFGRSRGSIEAAAAAVEGAEWAYADVRWARRLAIMQRFFEVILADLRYARDNEAMAVAFVDLDRLRNRHELGQVSDIRVAEAEAHYQSLRKRRYASDAERRTARAALARALIRPDAVPGDLVEPELPGNAREPPALEPLTERALEANPRLKALRAEREAAEARLSAARARRRPVLRGEVAAGEFARQIGSRDDWEAALVLEVPLFTGDRVAAAIAEAQAERRRAAAELHRAEARVSQAVIEAWEEIGVLRAQRDEARALLDYRDLYLDRARTEYAMELRTDLGDSMVRWSEARLREARTEFALALAWARLRALTGGALEADAGAADDGGGS